MKDRLIHLSWPSKIMFGMAISVYLLVTYWLWWPFYDPMKINSIKVLTDPTYAGGTMLYEVDYSKTTAYPVVVVSRQLIDGTVITLAPVKGSHLPLGDNTIRVPVTIPANCCEGIYTLHLSATYQINPLRTITIESTSPPFTVKNRNIQMLLELGADYENNRRAIK